MPSFTTIHDVKEITFPAHASPEADLYVYDHGVNVPFLIKRTFVVDASQACNRGFHAHKECVQLLVCLKGEIVLKVLDGSGTKTITMNNSSKGVLVPAGLWGEQDYSDDSLLMVLTDQSYDEEDYIRNYDDFLEYRKTLA